MNFLDVIAEPLGSNPWISIVLALIVIVIILAVCGIFFLVKHLMHRNKE